MYIDKLDYIVRQHNNTYHSKIKMEPVDLKPISYNDSSKEINGKDPKFKIGGIVRISKYKNIFAKDYVLNWFEEVFLVEKVKNTFPWTYVISDYKDEEIVGMFYKK